jgi:predicted HicB family RNase H-like nuclease
VEILKYKEFEGSAELDLTRSVCRGKILFIDDVVTYESKSIIGLQKQFEDAVDDYVETCNQIGKLAQKSCRGQFNVRVGSGLHREAVRRSISENISLNEVVSRALKYYLVPATGDGVSVIAATGGRLNAVTGSLSSSHALSIDKSHQPDYGDHQSSPIYLGAMGNTVDLTRVENTQAYVN